MNGADRKVLQVRELVEGVGQVPLGDGGYDLQPTRPPGSSASRTARFSATVTEGPSPLVPNGMTPVTPWPASHADVREIGVDVDAVAVVVAERRHVRDVDAAQEPAGWSRLHAHLPSSTVWSRNAVSSRRLGRPS